MTKRSAVALCVIALISSLAFPNCGVAQGKSLKDQLVGTWIYVSSTGKREDGSAVQRPSLHGAVTYTADGRFHFITVRSDAPRYASSDPARPSPEEAMAIASGVVAYTGTYTVEEAAHFGEGVRSDRVRPNGRPSALYQSGKRRIRRT
jgi:hypothetical protein